MYFAAKIKFGKNNINKTGGGTAPEYDKAEKVVLRNWESTTSATGIIGLPETGV